MVVDATRKLTPGEVEKAVAGLGGVDRKTVKLAIKNLVSFGELSYTYLYGTSFLERSFDRPVRISKRIVIKPPDKSYQPQPGEVALDIAGGAAFGNGAHPTTCLVLKALDCLFFIGRNPPLNGLDMGTGTGILAIALAKLGFQEVVAIDVDPCAIAEATNNVRLNNLVDHVTVSGMPLEGVMMSFTVIVANLASPTLSRLAALFSAKTERDGFLILSGFKEPASKDLIETYTQHGFSVNREEMDREWACLTFCKLEP